MTTEEVHNYNRRKAVAELSFDAVCTNEFMIQMRKWMRGHLERAYDAGFKAAKEGLL